MPYFMDFHDDVDATPEEVADAHLLDLAVQAKYGVNYLSYWHDPDSHNVFCLVEAPDRESAEAVHREAHGLTASRIIQVEGGTVAGFLGSVVEPDPGTPHVETAFRSILFTDLVGSTAIAHNHGDAKHMEVLRLHDTVVRNALGEVGGSEVKHTGDGIMASFASVSRSVDCAIEIQRHLDQHNQEASIPVEVRIGVSAGEPVTEHDDLFGAAVQLAARACDRATARSILVSVAVRELCVGKGFTFEPRGPFELKGFPEPVTLYEVPWATG